MVCGEYEDGTKKNRQEKKCRTEKKKKKLAECSENHPFFPAHLFPAVFNGSGRLCYFLPSCSNSGGSCFIGSAGWGIDKVLFFFGGDCQAHAIHVCMNGYRLFNS